MARAMIFLADPRNGAAGDDDSTILDEALALLDRATEGDETGLTRLELAEAERARGTIAARLASQFGRGSELLTVARAALARARDLYQATENDVEADAIDRQIDALDPQADTSRADDTAPDVAGVAA